MSVSRFAIINEVPFDRDIVGGDFQLHDAEIDVTAFVGPLVVVYQGIERPTAVGAWSMIEAGTVVGHDARIEGNVEIASNSGIGGFAIVRRGAKIGTGATLLPYVCVGAGARVGAGAVVTKHVMAGSTVAGVPAEPLVPRSSAVNRNNGKLRCGCGEGSVWDGCPQHGSKPVC